MSKLWSVSLLLVALIVSGLAADTQDVFIEDEDDSKDIMQAELFASKCNLRTTCYKYRHYYFETTTKRTRNDALKHCRSMQMSLYDLETCDEDSFITNILKTVKSCGAMSWWTSGYQTDAGNWAWETGKTIVYTNWKLGQPIAKKNTDYCIELLGYYLQWNVVSCKDKKYYICKSYGCSC